MPIEGKVVFRWVEEVGEADVEAADEWQRSDQVAEDGVIRGHRGRSPVVVVVAARRYAW